MGCGASKSTGTTPDSSSEKTIGADEKLEEEANKEDTNEESIIKKHPPKPSQRLEEQPQTVLKCEDLIENKLISSPKSENKVENKEISKEDDSSDSPEIEKDKEE